MFVWFAFFSESVTVVCGRLKGKSCFSLVYDELVGPLGGGGRWTESVLGG